MTSSKNIVLVGATEKPHRYAYMALEQLLNNNYDVFPVHPRLQFLSGIRVYNHLSDIDQDIDTVTMYVGSARSDNMIADILKLKPRRIIFNPGAENSSLEIAAREQGIETLNACTLVMLSTGQF